MSKYKTINAVQGNLESLEESIKKKVMDKHKNIATIDNDDVEQTLMSTNKSIIFIKLPKKHQQIANNFRSSLYESSLRRLKQQNCNIFKQTKIPSITERKKDYSLFEYDLLRKNNFKMEMPNDILPSLYRSLEKLDEVGFGSAKKLQEKSIEQKEQQQDQEQISKRYETLEKKSIFEIDGSVLGFKNLKQKFLQLKQISLNSHRKSDLLEKDTKRRRQIEEEENSHTFEHKLQEHRYKMDKQIEKHMNRYNKKDFFQTKLNGLKTTLYPADKSQFKKHQNVFRRRQEYLSQQKEHFTNFVNRKKTKNNIPIYFSRQKVEKSVENPEAYHKIMNDCSPWQTDLI